MSKLVAVLGLLYVTTTLADPPAATESEEKLAKVILPTLPNNGPLQSVNPDNCLDKRTYKDTEELLKVKDESDYLCAYIAYQANKEADDGVGLYKDKKEATLRYTCFKQSVDEVNAVNSQQLSWTAGINKFSDMTPKERNQYLGFGYNSAKKDLPDNCDTPAAKEDDEVDEAPDGLGSSGFGAPPPGGLGSSAGSPPRGAKPPRAMPPTRLGAPNPRGA
ncbi:hypothetical protein ACHWQZ_G017893 [Mnemiopsis leidyi]